MREGTENILESGRVDADIQRRLQEMTILNQVTTVIASAADVTEALYQVCAELARFLQVPQAGFAVFNRQRTAAKVVADYHPPDSPSALGAVIPVEDNPSMVYILRHKAPLMVVDAQTDPRLTPVHAIMRQRNVQSILIVPIVAGGEVIGTLGFDTFERREFSDSDIDLVQRVTSQVGQALRRKQAEEALKEAEGRARQRTALLESLRAVGLDLTSELDLDTLLRSVVSQAMTLLGGSVSGLYLYRPDRDVLEWAMGIGRGTLPIGSVLRRGEGLSGRVWETGRHLIVDDYQEWEGRAAGYEGRPTLAVVSVPIRWGEELLGVVNVGARPPRTFCL